MDLRSQNSISISIKNLRNQILKLMKNFIKNRKKDKKYWMKRNESMNKKNLKNILSCPKLITK